MADMLKLLDEKLELNARIDALEASIKSNPPGMSADLMLQKEQLAAMKTYARILQLRLDIHNDLRRKEQ